MHGQQNFKNILKEETKTDIVAKWCLLITAGYPLAQTVTTNESNCGSDGCAGI